MGRPTCTRIPRTVAAAAALLTAAHLSLPAHAEPKQGKPKHTNRLAQETSPYLRQHAHNPVDWYPWSAEAFAKAKKEKKLVFLSVGYSSCYWCHVMERESFENEDVAKLLNDGFVCIKVDREERPDIDQIYMTALNILSEHGGWPMSMFLTADGKPIVGGTYWPREDREIEGQKVRGFKSIVKLVHDIYKKSPDDVEKQADELAGTTKDALARAARGVALVDLDRSLVDGAVEAVKEEYDPQYGGFGTRSRRFRGPKFPVPPYLDLLLLEVGRTKSDELNEMLTKTLDGMAQGGIYDQLGGGFHRYSTERTWTVPHFEKMLYDNAQLVEMYSRAYTLTKKPLYRRIVEETLAFIAREMTSPEGGFYSALDAETAAEEGRFYVWTPKELNAVLIGEKDAGLFKKTYGLDDAPNFESKYYILVLAQPQAETEARLAPLRKKLLDARAKRPRPFLDTKILTAWNGQMIAGYAVAGKELQEPKYTAAAAKAADFVLKQLRTKDGRLLRSYAAQPGKPAEPRLNAYLDDYAYLVHGLLCLHDATGDKKWLEEAKTLTDAMVQHFGDKDRGGFFYTSHDHEKLFARAKDQHDGAQPSGNSQAARNLVRLATKTGEARYREMAEKTIKAFSTPLKSAPTSVTTLAAALDLHLAAATGNAPAKPKDPSDKSLTKSDSVVKVTVKAAPEKPGADGKQVLTITLAMEKGWHIYANPVGNEQFESAQTAVAVASKIKPASVKIEYPDGKTVKDKLAGDYQIYEDKVTIKATFQRAKGDSSPLEVSIRLMSCNSKGVCLLPATVKVKVPADK